MTLREELVDLVSRHGIEAVAKEVALLCKEYGLLGRDAVRAVDAKAAGRIGLRVAGELFRGLLDEASGSSGAGGRRTTRRTRFLRRTRFFGSSSATFIACGWTSCSFSATALFSGAAARCFATARSSFSSSGGRSGGMSFAEHVAASLDRR
jgi:hypothetical protein